MQWHASFHLVVYGPYSCRFISIPILQPHWENNLFSFSLKRRRVLLRVEYKTRKMSKPTPKTSFFRIDVKTSLKNLYSSIRQSRIETSPSPFDFVKERRASVGSFLTSKNWKRLRVRSWWKNRLFSSPSPQAKVRSQRDIKRWVEFHR